MSDRPVPPVAALKPHSYERHGVMIEDPYHWLRDPKYPTVDDPEILAHLEAENAYFRAVMQPLEPLVETLFAEMKGRIKEDDASVPVEENGHLYQWRFETGAQYRKWYRRPVGGGPEELLLDEPALAEGKEFFKLAAFSVSPDGKLLAYSADDSGAERFTLHVKNLETGALLPVEIPETMGQPVWSADGRVLLYTVVNQAWRPYQIRAHVLGRPVSEDQVLYEETDEGFRVGVAKSQSREVIFLLTGDHVTSEVRFVPAADPFAIQHLIAAREPGREYHVDHGGGALYIRVNDTHKNFRVVRASLTAPEPAYWVELIAGSDQRYIRGLVAFQRFLALEERHNGLDQVILRQADGTEFAVEFPEAAYQAGIGATPAVDPATIRLEYSSMATPATTYDFDVTERRLTVLKVQEIPSGYDPGDYATERLMAPARDGALVPISLVYRKGWTKGRGKPLHLYGYGAYGLGMSPSFSSARISLLDRGFAYAIAHIRGGDELGYGWYEAGKLDRRHNTFNDFIDAARFLEAEGYAAPGGISASGGSAGGQLMGVIVNEAPELWRAVVAHVPFVDALNTMQDASLPLTPPEWPEWGNPITDRAAFEHIRSYSPYDNVEAQAYPPLMITAGLNDPRVTYWEPAKWAAKLRALKTDDNVLVSKTNMGAGHGGKSGRFDRLIEVAEEYAFVIDAFGG
ncbi:oligopeptidase B [Aliidongia dinghuensis]|uniref:Oligopeptidase B n=1 Tax=Aliidongia dinghuensis TaxID=1867774 RepID=A0A8J3E4U2_9PROT|nr:S9 family peptidase [Aliidongia dinghuensis]GGF41603.1 oligopeptidase B [Aliidongia dinghuensis]